MMAVTHAAISAAAVGLSLSTVDPGVLAIAIAASQIPDIDTSTSLIGQILWPISRWIEKRYPHRSVTHSLIFTVGLALISIALWWCYQIDVKMAIALPLGHLVACFSDTFTKAGVQLFWPSPLWCVFGLNPKRRLTTGGTGEYWVLAIAAAVLIAAINLSGTGGPTALVGTSLGLRSNAIETYQQSSASNHIYANVTGTFAADSSTADGKYFIVAADGSEFILFKKKQVFKTNQNVIPTRLTAAVGSPASSSVQTLEFDDEVFSIAPPQNTLVFVTGELLIDDPELIRIPANPKQFEVAKLTGDKINFSYCPLEKAIALLKDQVVSGSLEAKIFTPTPDVREK